MYRFGGIIKRIDALLGSATLLVLYKNISKTRYDLGRRKHCRSREINYKATTVVVFVANAYSTFGAIGCM